MSNNNNQFSYGEFTWFTGVVTEINDPLKAGRVKVRIHGYHNQDDSEMPDDHLQWALVMTSPFSASTGGIGLTPHGLVKDAHVIGFFMDGKSAQHPMVMGTFPAMNGDTPDVNKLARGEKINKEIEKNSSWGEKPNDAEPQYPHNKVIHTTSGHIVELDDTPNKERINIHHKSGSFYEFHTDGSVVQKIKGESNLIIDKEQKIHVKGNANILIDGNVTEKIMGNKTTEIIGNYQIKCQSYSLKTTATYNLNVGSSSYMKSGGVMTAKASMIMLN